MGHKQPFLDSIRKISSILFLAPLFALSGCKSGSGGPAPTASTPVLTAPTTSTPTPTPSSTPSQSIFVGPDPSIPTFAGAPADQTLIASAMTAAGVSLTPPAAVTTVYVAPPTSYTSIGAAQIGSGTQANPYQNLIAVVNAATTGEHILLEPGTYEMASMASAFGESADGLMPTNSGTQADPIVVETDPGALDWSTGQVAILDFQDQTSVPAGSRYAAIWPQAYWTFENIDAQNALDRIFWLAARGDVLYHNDLHNVTLSGTQDNVGIVGVMRLTGGNYDDFIIGNNIHGLAQYSGTTATSYDMPGPTADDTNIGCTYSENDQYYTTESNLSSVTNVNSLTATQMAGYMAPPDSNVYFYANVVHGCLRGIANKEPAVGPWYVLSNVIYNVQVGVRMPVSGTMTSPMPIRNNIIYSSGAQTLLDGIQLGIGITDRFLGNADNATVSNNTVINASLAATALYGGWNDVVDNNVFVTTGSGVAHLVYPGGYVNGGTNTSGQTWYDNGTWPNAMGEYLFALNASNPYYSAMPNFLQDEAGSYNAISFGNNLYTSTPTVVIGATPLAGPNLNGTDIDQNAQVLSWSSLMPLFRDVATDDYRAGTSPGVLATVGSQIP